MTDPARNASGAAPGTTIDDTSAPLFGREEALNMIGGDEDLLNEVADLARGEIPKQLAALHAALDAGDAPTAHRHAHTLKGTVATLGAERVRDAAFVAEQAARHADLDSARAATVALDTLVTRLVAELTAHLKAAGRA
jgi:HPt (histidine-containing phosphotransfer) domain-containing protein